MVANHDEGWRLVSRNTLNLRKAWLGLRAIRVNYGGHAYIAYTSACWDEHATLCLFVCSKRLAVYLLLARDASGL